MASTKKTGASPGRLRNIHVRLNPAEAARVESDMNIFRETNVGALKPGAYAKAAVLAYPRYRRMEAELRDIARHSRGGKIAARLQSLLATAPPPALSHLRKHREAT